MNYYAVVLVPVRVDLTAENRMVASEEAREWARRQPVVDEQIAKVLSVHYSFSDEPPHQA